MALNNTKQAWIKAKSTDPDWNRRLVAAKNDLDISIVNGHWHSVDDLESRYYSVVREKLRQPPPQAGAKAQGYGVTFKRMRF